MLVATLRFVDGRRYGLSDDDIQRLVEERRNSVLISAMRSLSIENLQALVILAFTTIGNGEPSKTWSIIASMTRTVDFLQLTTEGEHAKTRHLLPAMPLSTPIDWVQEEERRRVFWNVFNLDSKDIAPSQQGKISHT
ncbi:Fungal-trans domain-containing protein [Fusarium keratoplasticum]|nr:Fungal-trans domain-containing protein [Fusarium keratoplasticum]